MATKICGIKGLCLKVGGEEFVVVVAKTTHEQKPNNVLKNS